MSEPIRVLLVEDHQWARELMADLLDLHPDLTIVGQAGSVAEAGELLAAGCVADVAVVDLDLPDGSGVAVIRDLRRRNPDAQVLVLTGVRERRVHALAVEAGAAGVVHKAASTGEVVAAIRRLAAGELLLGPREAIELLRLAGEVQAERREADRRFGPLTPREREVLRALAEGLDNAGMAARFSVSEETVRVHVRNLLAKLEVDSRLQAVALAHRHGIIPRE